MTMVDNVPHCLTLADIGGHWSIESQHSQVYIDLVSTRGKSSCFTRQTPSHPAHTSSLGKIGTVPYSLSRISRILHYP
jgi:hypothetical protein